MREKSVITGTGSYLPDKILTNKDLEKIVDTSDEWIQQRTGIRERRIADETQTTAHMGTRAAIKALEAAGIKGEDIDGIIVATSTPDTTFPSVAVHIQTAISAGFGPMFDVQAVCSGFVYALSIADSMLQAGHGTRFLVVGSEKFSNILNWNDRSTCVLFGDGAGAVVLERQQSDTKTSLEASGIHSTHLHANGQLKEILYTDGGVATTKHAGHIVMNGREVFRHAVDLMAEVVNETLAYNNIKADDIDWLIPHQANIRIIESTRKKLRLPEDKVVITVHEHGNTSAASIPLALDKAVRDGRVKKGDLLLLEALGAGLTWGSALIRY